MLVEEPENPVLRVLILEDLPTDAELMERELRATNLSFTARRVSTKESFLRELEQFEPDITLVDYHLPRFDGMSALHLVQERFPAIPVILVTGASSEEIAVDCMKAGAADYILKDRLARLGPAVRSVLKRRREREALYESEMKFRSLAHSASDAIISADGSENITFWNEAAHRMFGYAEEDALGLSLSLLLAEGCRDTCRTRMEELRLMNRSEKIGGTLELSGVRKDGSEFPLELSLGAWMTGEQASYISIVRDITARVEAEWERKRLATTLEQVGEGIVITDTSGAILYVNPAFEQMTGYSREEALGRSSRILKSGKHDRAFYQELWDTITKGEVWRARLTNKKKDGTLYEEQTTISPIVDGSGKTAGYVSVKRDVSSEVMLEAEFRQAHKLEAVGRLAAGVAHDFNNVVTVILGTCELLLGDLDTNDPVRKDLVQIQRAGRRAKTLTGQLLAFSRKQVLEPKVLDLNSTVVEIEKMLPRLIGEDVELIMELDPALGSVKADPSQIDQIIMNLAVNARDSMPLGGKLIIESANVDLDEAYTDKHGPAKAGPYVMLALSDTGCGMDEETRSKIFEPFFTTKEKGKGTGLGLSSVFGIVKQSSGYIWVYSEPGQGTTFKIYLPRVQRVAESRDRGVAAVTELQGSETLLIVEDDEGVRSISQKILSGKGYKVLAARDGKEALDVCRRPAGPIHLMITDLVMPGIGGRELGERVGPLQPEMRVLYISGYADHAVLVQGGLEPGSNFLQKPFTPDGLLRRVRGVLDAPRSTGAPSPSPEMRRSRE